MIDTTREKLISLGEVPAYLESRGLGRRVHRAVVYRWVLNGCDGIRLEAVKIGGIRVTSAEAIQRWVEARQQLKEGAHAPHAAPQWAAPRYEPRPSHVHLMSREEVDRTLEDHRLSPTELDRALAELTRFPESTRSHVGSVLFRAGLRKVSDLRAKGTETLLKMRGIGPTSRPVALALKELLDARR